jgi:hypothetical protein
MTGKLSKGVLTQYVDPSSLVRWSRGQRSLRAALGLVIVGRRTSRSDIRNMLVGVGGDTIGRSSGRTFSCQLRRTLIAWPPPSPPPREWTCENPVACGVRFRDVLAAFDCAMPLYLVVVSQCCFGTEAKWSVGQKGGTQAAQARKERPQGGQGTRALPERGSRAYIYFISTSNPSVPPGALYIRLNIGDMSA